MVSKDVDVMLHGAMIPLSMDTLVLNSIKRREEKKKRGNNAPQQTGRQEQNTRLVFLFFFVPEKLHNVLGVLSSFSTKSSSCRRCVFVYRTVHDVLRALSLFFFF